MLEGWDLLRFHSSLFGGGNCRVSKRLRLDWKVSTGAIRLTIPRSGHGRNFQVRGREPCRAHQREARRISPAGQN